MEDRSECPEPAEAAAAIALDFQNQLPAGLQGLAWGAGARKINSQKLSGEL